MNAPLVSIIIPTYDMAHLITETLDSVLAQTYAHWECIVVDDGSSDSTETIIQDYIAKDNRFQYHKRPDTHLSGGNGARNYGYEVSRGEFIQWFDSDDIMIPESIAIKVETILNTKVDFVISKTKYFNRPNYKGYAYDYKAEDVTFLSFSTTYIDWITDDIFLDRNIIKNLRFNETLKAGQEYNFSCKLLLATNNLVKIDQFLSLRRYHESSIGTARRSNKKYYWQTNYHLHWTTLNEVKRIKAVSPTYIKYALYKCTKSILENPDIKTTLSFHKALLNVFHFRVVYFYLGLLSKLCFNKYHFFYKNFKK
ncbi:glycosyltransferase family 2 protein [uncultured Algibacter sp.]|uniref:glycosyltransferase family 2 protein n=1 Tax=uncultured Algibacter sp. TaxID=298659 RepID=UPI002602E8EF|nr:glycosyltransferase family 2 protein [uncultured Algibacter sp.]